jgi:hypothetical protein
MLEAARELCQRLRSGRSAPGLAFFGLNGSGRSVLLHALADLAEQEACAVQFLDLESAADFVPTALPAVPRLILLDDAQFLENALLGRLLGAQERLMALGRPVALVLASLPLTTRLEQDAAKRLERCLRVFRLEALDENATAEAVSSVASWDESGLKELWRLSKGWPMHVQAFAAAAWSAARGSILNREAVRAGAQAALARLDAVFYGPGFEQLSPREKQYLRSMAHLGPGPHRSSDIADSMDAKITSLGPLRAKLLAKGWVYSPEHGLLGFTAPGMDESIRRVMPGFR